MCRGDPVTIQRETEPEHVGSVDLLLTGLLACGPVVCPVSDWLAVLSHPHVCQRGTEFRGMAQVGPPHYHLLLFL